ncbi:DNA translocase FtsK [Erysipelothrix rhusiopathiae]|nr:DNA translocase FtsK [Erysipelothrix rhusiopathiae]
MKKFKENLINLISKLINIILSILAIFALIGALALFSKTPKYPRDIGGGILFVVLMIVFLFLVFKNRHGDYFFNSNRKITTNNDNNIEIFNELKAELITIQDTKTIQKNKNDKDESSIEPEPKIIIIKNSVPNSDPLFLEVVNYVLSMQKASTSMLQRRFRIGYNRAYNLIDQLEEEGIVGLAQGSKPRDVFYPSDTKIKIESNMKSYNYSSEDNPINDAGLNNINSHLKKIITDKNVYNNDDDFNRVIKYACSLESFDMNKFQQEFDFDFAKTSSYIETLRNLEIIDYKNELTKQYTEEDIHHLIREATLLNPQIITERRLDSLSNNEEFIVYISNLLEQSGYNSSIIPISNNYGVHIIAKKDEIIYAIHCKHHLSKVGKVPIQILVAGMSHYNAHIGIVVTNNYFNNPAKDLALTNKVITWDRDRLKTMIENERENNDK